MKNSRSFFINTGIMTIALLLSLLLCETFIRAALFYKSRNEFKKVMGSLPEIESGKEAGLGQIIRPSANPKIIYELRPDMDVYFANAAVKTNHIGCRSDRNIHLKKDAGTVRILGLGDSYMFGQGVNQEKNLLDVLEAELNKRFTQRSWEVINAAVPGYNTVMEVETLKEKYLKYKPDIVIIEFIGNDFQLPNFIYDVADWRDLKKSFFMELLVKKYSSLPSNFKLSGAPLNFKLGWGFEDDACRVPEMYKDAVGWDSYVRAMKILKKVQKKYGFDVISFLTLGYKDDRVFNLSTQLGFYTTYNDAYDSQDLSLVISKNDIHPSESGHKKNAEKLLNFMIDEKIIEKYLSGIN
ncbi:MAG: SGNH/GDSL hydrolase family protein [Candidatus Omnitrophota bacterium]|jgi:hypothetical protein